jgi:hypothetical protein
MLAVLKSSNRDWHKRFVRCRNDDRINIVAGYDILPIPGNRALHLLAYRSEP